MRRTLALIAFSLLAATVAWGNHRYVVNEVASETITGISQDRDGAILFSTLRGVYRYTGQEFSTLPLTNNPNVTSLITTRDGDIFASTVTAIVTYRNGEFTFFAENKHTKCLIDAGDFGIAALSTTGIRLYNPTDGTIRKETVFQREELYDSQDYSIREELHIDSRRHLWVVRGNTVSVYDMNLTRLRTIPFTERINDTEYFPDDHRMGVATTNGFYVIDDDSFAVTKHIPDGNILFISGDFEGFFTFGIAGEGIFIHSMKDFINITVLEEEKLGVGNCLCYIQDSKYLWLSKDHVGVEYYDLSAYKDKRFVSLINATDNKEIEAMTEDAAGNVWLRVDGRTAKFDWTDGSFAYADKPSGVVFPEKDAEDSDGLIGMGAYRNTYRDAYDQLWVTDEGVITHYYPSSGDSAFFFPPSTSYFFSILEDNNHNIWLGSENGLIRIDRASGKLEQFNSTSRYNYTDVAMKDSRGILYFAYSSGLTVIDPAFPELIDIDDIPFSIKRIYVNGEVLPHGSGGAPGQGGEAVFTHERNNISFSLSYINYDFMPIRYVYRLEGYDQQATTSANSLVSYSKLPRGSYTFRVKLFGMDDSLAQTFSFRIKPPLYKTAGAYVGYALLLLGLGAMAVTSARRRRTLAEARQRQKLQNELNEQKINFFTNISHEFRTPLSLIYGPLKDIERSEPETSETARKLSLIDRSVQKMLQLTNQLLEYNNLDLDSGRLSLARKDIAASLREIVDTFSDAAAKAGLTLTLGGPDSRTCLFDEVKLNRIMSNLLSNAIKYSEPGGSIEVSLAEADAATANAEFPGTDFACGCISIRVADTGIGIAEDKLQAVFERHHRELHEGSMREVSGFGIGLHYTRQLIELHHGRIKAEQNHPKGTVMGFMIPADDEAYAADLARESGGEAYGRDAAGQPADEDCRGAAGDGRPCASDAAGTVGDRAEADEASPERTILIVEDNDDMRGYVSEILGRKWRTAAVRDGRECLDYLEGNYADLVLSDVMMPRMDGWTLCGEIKGNSVFNGLAVILLTAKGDLSSQIRGLNLGADAYVSKPFDPEYLTAVVGSVLRNREQRQRLIGRTTSGSISASTGDAALSEEEKDFLGRYYGLIDAHIAEEDVNIDFYAKELALSRTAFYTKVKSLTGMSPQQFLNAYRMNKAAELLAAGRHNVNEVAEIVGFQSREGFTRAFKRAFGLAPKDYARQ